MKKTQSHLLQTDEKYPSFFKTQMDSHYFLLCIAPSSRTLRERGISPQPLRQPIKGGLAVSHVLLLVIFRPSAALFGRFPCPWVADLPPQTGVCRDVTGNEEVNNFDRVRFKATLFCLWSPNQRAPSLGITALISYTVVPQHVFIVPLRSCHFLATECLCFAATSFEPSLCNLNTITTTIDSTQLK